MSEAAAVVKIVDVYHPGHATLVSDAQGTFLSTPLLVPYRTADRWVLGASKAPIQFPLRAYPGHKISGWTLYIERTVAGLGTGVTLKKLGVDGTSSNVGVSYSAAPQPIGYNPMTRTVTANQTRLDGEAFTMVIEGVGISGDKIGQLSVTWVPI